MGRLSNSQVATPIVPSELDPLVQYRIGKVLAAHTRAYRTLSRNRVRLLALFSFILGALFLWLSVGSRPQAIDVSGLMLLLIALGFWLVTYGILFWAPRRKVPVEQLASIRDDPNIVDELQNLLDYTLRGLATDPVTMTFAVLDEFERLAVQGAWQRLSQTYSQEN